MAFLLSGLGNSFSVSLLPMGSTVEVLRQLPARPQCASSLINDSVITCMLACLHCYHSHGSGFTSAVQAGQWHGALLCDTIVCLVRKHAYGDVYSSPGLDLRQKQLLGSAFLVR